MLQQVIEALTSWIVGSISALGYFGVFVLMEIESDCIPLPSAIIMPFACYLPFKRQFTLVGAATVGAVGCNFGSTVAYVIAAKGGRKAIERWGAYVLLSPTELA
jgi:membrane protein DedA with SNARE-associated domain